MTFPFEPSFQPALWIGKSTECQPGAVSSKTTTLPNIISKRNFRSWWIGCGPGVRTWRWNGGSLKGCIGHENARRATETHDDLLREALDRSEEYKFYSSKIEHVA